MKIHNIDQLIEYAIQCHIGNTKIEKIELDDHFNVRISICGESWSEFIDYRCANYIINLQSQLNRIIKEYVIEGHSEYNLAKKEAIVKVKVNKGSSLINVDLSNSFQFIFGAMTSTQIFLLCSLSIVSLVGYFSYSKFLYFKENALRKSEDEKTKRALAETLNEVIRKFDSLEKPIRSLLKGMETEDKIRLPGMSESLSYYDAKKLYPKKPRTRSLEGYIDDNFLITDIKLETPVQVSLEKGGISFKALVELPEEMLKHFYSTLEEKHKNKELPFSIHLQVHASMTERRINYAIIQGIGEAREGSYDITKIVKLQ